MCVCVLWSHCVWLDLLKIIWENISWPNVFDNDLILPNLEILQGDFPQHIFGSLKLLQIVDDDSACLPLGLLERFHNLEYLLLGYSSYIEIFSNEAGYLEKEVGKFAVAPIKHLQLVYLNHLKQLWKQDSKLDSIGQHLEILRVFHCQNLFSLLPRHRYLLGI